MSWYSQNRLSQPPLLTLYGMDSPVYLHHTGVSEVLHKQRRVDCGRHENYAEIREGVYHVSHHYQQKISLKEKNMTIP